MGTKELRELIFLKKLAFMHFFRHVASYLAQNKESFILLTSKATVAMTNGASGEL